MLPLAVPDTWFSRVAWLPDSSGFYFPAGDYTSGDPRDLLFLAVGDEMPQRESIADLPVAWVMPEAGNYPQVSADGRWLTLSSDRFGGRIWLARRLPDGQWFEVLEDRATTRAYGAVDGDDYVAVTTEDAPRGRVVRIPLESGHDRSTWVELLPESDEVLVHVSLVRRALCGLQSGRRGRARSCVPSGLVARRRAAPAGARRRGRACDEWQLQGLPSHGRGERRRLRRGVHVHVRLAGPLAGDLSLRCPVPPAGPGAAVGARP